ncbi:carcinoembryonic antigen-related cell adhesion molecule 20 isoform X2 [Xenopus tropicalis]|uniref:Carcinoembryonic antigen-related cell adhesion molecule 20 isoform X2 n=1 Tax=Xenopus tropicalis TaxID=8364 RepID=A0A8J1JWP7_XENTR|nr:carcinoembryonic antigen-related cell adhesion molecule 20 isoform X2 [Xenopus tropicalis]
MRGYLLTVFISLWMESGYGTDVQLIPSHPLVNKSVTLNVRGITGTLRYFRWYLGSRIDAANQILHYNPNVNPPQLPGVQYFPRAHGLPNGSLHISDLAHTDQGMYTVMILTGGMERLTVHLPVYEPVTKPVIRCSSPHPKVNETISLICETANWERISWSKDSSSLPSRADLSPDNRTVTLHNITFSDTGQYQCEAKNTVSRSIMSLIWTTVLLLWPGSSAAPLQALRSSSVQRFCCTRNISFPRERSKKNNPLRDRTHTEYIIMFMLLQWLSLQKRNCHTWDLNTQRRIHTAS